MIFLLISWLNFLIALPQQPDIYYVVHVQGLIINQTRKDTLSVGDKLYSTDKLLFKSRKATASILSPTRGRFALGQPANAKPTATGEFIALLQNVLIGEKSVAKLSTRSLPVDKVVDLKSVFASDTFVFVGNHAKIILDPSTHPMSADHYFMYRYTYNTDKVARKKIAHSGDTLIFDKKILYTVNGHSLMPREIKEVEIHKVDAVQKSSMLIASITPIFVSDAVLAKELQLICDVLKAAHIAEEQILEQMYNHIVSIYGETDKNMLRLWVNEHLK